MDVPDSRDVPARTMTWHTLFLDVHLATFQEEGSYGVIKKGAIAVEDGRIVWVGPVAKLPAPPEELAETVRRLGGRWLTPGLIDCHTHLVFGGDRAREFEERLEGVSYEEIARRGGGINSTVRATRAADGDTLAAAAGRRLGRLLEDGVTTIEIKSGYGLDLETELRMLRVARQLGREHSVTVRTSFLGAHAFPPEYRDRPEAYVDLVCEEMLPEAARLTLADAVDGFLEGIAFSPSQIERVFAAARHHRLPVKLHADQLSDLGGAALAAGFGALSADHLEYTSQEGVCAMARAGTVAVLLPGAFYTLREKKAPPVELFRRHSVPMAVATDCNPGSAPVLSLLLMLNMACTFFGLTPVEALAGVTRNAARALGLADEIGTLEVGKRADFAIWDIGEPVELCYWIGGRAPVETVYAGRARE